MAHQRSTIKVFCKNDERTLARYSWDEADNVWVRSDQHGSNDDFYLRRLDDGTMQAYPRPTLECPCGNSPVYSHDEIQAKIAEAVRNDERLMV
ncbi:hypothetical protein [Agromyces rhizosphaerae]|nr:hypothetical protein [Agromyces rhizosphaerae]